LKIDGIGVRLSGAVERDRGDRRRRTPCGESWGWIHGGAACERGPAGERLADRFVDEAVKWAYGNAHRARSAEIVHLAGCLRMQRWNALQAAAPLVAAQAEAAGTERDLEMSLAKAAAASEAEGWNPHRR
jgi:hypothetical protein